MGGLVRAGKGELRGRTSMFGVCQLWFGQWHGRSWSKVVLRSLV